MTRAYYRHHNGRPTIITAFLCDPCAKVATGCSLADATPTMAPCFWCERFPRKDAR